MGNRDWSPPGRGSEPESESAPAVLPAAAWTVGSFVAPVLLYAVWAATRPGTARPGCVNDAGDPCLSPRAEAFVALGGTASNLASALALALLAAVLLRRITPTWRASAVGVAAAVIGAGAATLLLAAIG